MRHVLVPLLGELTALHPEIRIEVRATNELVRPRRGGIDLALRTGSLDGLPGHVQQPWFATPWVICAAPSYLARHPAPTSIAALAGHDLVGFRNPRTGQIAAWPHAGGGRYEPAPRLAFDDGDAVWGAMLAGAGIACAPLYLAATSLRNKTAVEVLATSRETDVTVAMVRRERRLTPGRLTTLIAFLAARAPLLSDVR